MKIKHYVNHVVLTIDASSSMQGLTKQVVEVVDSQVKHLAQRSKENDEETRISVYMFNHNVNCLVYDMDVLRLPSIAQYYSPTGSTALIDATIVSLDELGKIPEIHDDHAFLIFVVTDGEENKSKNSSSKLTSIINSLKENWTLGILVPNQQGVHEAKKFGFPANNIQIWNTDAKGLSEAGANIRQATDTYMANRRLGIRGTKNLFSLDTSKLNVAQVTHSLQELSPSQYDLLPVRQDAVIKEFVENWGKIYVPGSCYYQLTKPEKVQAYKQIAIQNKTNGKLYTGSNARAILNLPNYEVKINLAEHPNYEILIQSTSTNRKLVSGTKLLVLK